MLRVLTFANLARAIGLAGLAYSFIIREPGMIAAAMGVIFAPQFIMPSKDR